MATLSKKISTVVLVVLENRSFDHMLGHLTYENLIAGANGLEQNLTQYANIYQGGEYLPFLMQDRPLSYDLPHEWNEVETQLSYSSVTQQYDMTGFVEAYANLTKTNPAQQADPMGFFASKTVPITSFLARNFRICNRWHAPFPSSTQPNRTMAFCGSSEIYDTSSGPRLIPTEDMLFNWLERNGIRWRVYHDGLSFFALYPRAWELVLGENFRDFEAYFQDMQTEPIETGPQVIIVEPSYNDSPHIGPDQPNDNHPPLAIGFGEEFLRRAYQAATVNPNRWRNTVVIHYYDEHGGFYDHVPPPPIPYTTKGNPAHAFKSLGVRIPGIIVSPYVDPASVCTELFDHTSVLQFLAEIFTPGIPYSAEVEDRKARGIKSISAALSDTPRADIPAVPNDPIPVQTILGTGVRVRPSNDLQASFELAAEKLMASNPAASAKKYPELFQWKAALDAERRKA
jgi:phospholipase C